MVPQLVRAVVKSLIQKPRTRVSIPQELVNPELFGQGFPFAIDKRFRFRIHHDFVGPGAGEAFGGPFAGGVDAHLRAVVGEAAGVVERIDGAERELDVALGIDVVENFESDVGEILHVNIFVDDDDALW